MFEILAIMGVFVAGFLVGLGVMWMYTKESIAEAERVFIVNQWLKKGGHEHTY